MQSDRENNSNDADGDEYGQERTARKFSIHVMRLHRGDRKHKTTRKLLLMYHILWHLSISTQNGCKLTIFAVSYRYMKTAFFGLEPWEKEYIEGELTKKNLDSDVIFVENPLDKDNLPQESDFEVASVFVNSSIDKEVLDTLPNLKFIVTRSTGYDHIDAEECKKRNITVSNVPFYGEHTVAEYSFGLILALSRKICEANDRVRDTGSFDLEGLQGFDLRDKTLGVIGGGSIGQNVVEIANGFKMNVLVCDVKPDEKLAEKLNFKYDEFENVLTKSDIVTLHVPYLKATHHLINAENIAKMKKGAYLINTSRGAVVETEALVGALKSGHLAGAGLDVLEEEGIMRDEFSFITKVDSKEHDLKAVLAGHVLIDMPNVIVTPHNAFNTKEALSRILNTTLDNIKSFIDGKPINLTR